MNPGEQTRIGLQAGLLACSLVFYTTMWLTDAPAVVELPSLGSVLLVNLLAGMVMGAHFQAASRKVRVSAAKTRRHG